MTADELQQRLAALNQDLTAAGAAVRITVKTADPEPQLLTRNRYRISHVEREADRVSFRLTIAERTGAWMRLTPAEFADLVADLGLRPVTPAATEYESVPIRQTTAVRMSEPPATTGGGS